jgi:hypothetical protein
MAPSPETKELIFLPQLELSNKFDELKMSKFLEDTCWRKKIDAPKVSPEVTGHVPSIQRQRWNSWRGETYLRKSDDECVCVLHWRKTLIGEQRSIETFTAPDGQVYAHDLSVLPAPGYIIKP